MIFCSLNVSVKSTIWTARTLISHIDGFFLDRNESDAIHLDDIILRELTKADVEELDLQQYLGYVYLHVICFLLHMMISV